MKKLLALTACFLFSITPMSMPSAAELKVSLMDPAWNGSTVPDKGICKHRDRRRLVACAQNLRYSRPAR